MTTEVTRAQFIKECFTNAKAIHLEIKKLFGVGPKTDTVSQAYQAYLNEISERAELTASEARVCRGCAGLQTLVGQKTQYCGALVNPKGFETDLQNAFKQEILITALPVSEGSKTRQFLRVRPCVRDIIPAQLLVPNPNYIGIGRRWRRSQP
jgi:hypothetical protein